MTTSDNNYDSSMNPQDDEFSSSTSGSIAMVYIKPQSEVNQSALFEVYINFCICSLMSVYISSLVVIFGDWPQAIHNPIIL